MVASDGGRGQAVGKGGVQRGGRAGRRLDRSLDTAILDAVLVGLAEQGYDRMSMDDIASRAGVGKAAIYRRWSSKATVVTDAIAHWRRQLGPVEPPNTGSLRGDVEALVGLVPDFNDADTSAIKVIVGVATAAVHSPVLAAALDDLALSTPRQMIRTVLDHAVARGEIPAGRDLTLVPDVAVGLNILRVLTGRPVDRVFVRRVLEEVIVPLASAPPSP
jgi:AcrR family transcriptional regulator